MPEPTPRNELIGTSREIIETNDPSPTNVSEHNTGIAEAQGVENDRLSEVRKNISQETRIHNKSLVQEAQSRHLESQITQTELTKETPRWKLPLRIFDSLPYAAMIISQFGGIHPWRSNGKWEWVIEPWASIKDNPGKGPPGEWEKYTDMFLDMRSRGIKTINLKVLGGENPKIKLSGMGGVTLLDSRRIRGAQAAGVRVVTNVNRS